MKYGEMMDALQDIIDGERALARDFIPGNSLAVAALARADAVLAAADEINRLRAEVRSLKKKLGVEIVDAD
jgi:hypothetical protein